MKKWHTTLFLLCIINLVYGQDISRLKGRAGNNNFDYYVMKPQAPVKGILILLPGLGEKPKSIFSKIKLPQILITQGYLAIVPQLPESLFADKTSIDELDEIIRVQLAQYNLKHTDIVLGGLSSGGAIALGYAAHLNALNKPLKLKGVLAVDPPADLTRMYRSAQRKIDYKCGELIKREGEMIKSYLNKALGGSPDAVPEKYEEYSAYSDGINNGGNARFLQNIPVRLYSEPDLECVRKQYCEALQFSDINAYDLEKMNAFLQKLGNNKAEYIKTKGRGFHSWNIIDVDECAQWISKL